MRQEITADIANAFNTDLADTVKDFTANVSSYLMMIGRLMIPKYYLPSITAVGAFLQAFTPMRLITRPSCKAMLS